MKEKWILGIGGSDLDGIVFCIIEGTEEEVRKFLFEKIITDRIQEQEEDVFDFGTESIEDLETRNYGENANSIYGFNCFYNHHTDYEVQKLSDVLTKIL